MTIHELIYLFITTATAGIILMRLGRRPALRLGFTTPRKLGRRRRDIPRNVPLLGGLGLGGAAALGLFLATPVQTGDVLLGATQVTDQLRATILAIGILWCGGMILDRLRRPSPTLLIITQCLAILVLLLSGVRVRAMTLPGGIEIPTPIGVVITAIFLFLMMQFSRVLDGIDGLLPTVALLLTLAQLRIVWNMDESFALSLGIVSLAGYTVLLMFNWYPAHCYMGNNGASIPGLLLGMVAIAARTKSFLTLSAIIPLIIILLTMGYIGLRFLERSLLMVRIPETPSTPRPTTNPHPPRGSSPSQIPRDGKTEFHKRNSIQ